MASFIKLKVQYPNKTIVNGTLDVHNGKYILSAAARMFADDVASKICAELAAAKVLNGASIVSVEVTC
jgi:hypothetical protein